MVKKFICVIIAVLVAALSVFPVLAADVGYTEIKDNGIRYRIYDKTGDVFVSCYDKTISGEVRILAEVDGHPVVRVSNSGFKDCKNITSVIIPEGVKEIYLNAFQNCTSLEKLNFRARWRLLWERPSPAAKSLGTRFFPKVSEFWERRLFLTAGI
ncbi:MAG: leucine-rich repeat protein [Clostridia bacterium]|nr:leucine-rich repeat protein [Clostridia bacterium]